MKKYIILAFIFIFCLFNKALVVKEISIFRFSEVFAGNLYDDYSAVSGNKIEVLDYYIYDDYIKIIPINNECRLPINGIITKAIDNEIEIEASDYKYTIKNINPSYYLYQYYKSNNKLGYSDEFYIYGDKCKEIIGSLIINYEEI